MPEKESVSEKRKIIQDFYEFIAMTVDFDDIHLTMNEYGVQIDVYWSSKDKES